LKLAFWPFGEEITFYKEIYRMLEEQKLSENIKFSNDVLFADGSRNLDGQKYLLLKNMTAFFVRKYVFVFNLLDPANSERIWIFDNGWGLNL